MAIQLNILIYIHLLVYETLLHFCIIIKWDFYEYILKILKVRQSRNGFFKPIFPKNEQMSSGFLPNSTICWILLFVFWKNSRIPKSPFEINWPLIRPTEEFTQHTSVTFYIVKFAPHICYARALHQIKVASLKRYNSDVTLTPHNGRWCWILNQLSATKNTEKS